MGSVSSLRYLAFEGMLAPAQLQLDNQFMQQALQLARQAADEGEIPVGAIVTANDSIVGTGRNQCIKLRDPTAHAEIVALRSAASSLGDHRLDGTTLYVTLEPCLMCCGALLQARVARLVFAAREPRTGGVVSIHEALRMPGVEPHVAITEGICSQQSALLLREFFSTRRVKPIG